MRKTHVAETREAGEERERNEGGCVSGRLKSVFCYVKKKKSQCNQKTHFISFSLMLELNGSKTKELDYHAIFFYRLTTHHINHTLRMSRARPQTHQHLCKHMLAISGLLYLVLTRLTL